MLVFTMLTNRRLCETRVPKGLTEAKLNSFLEGQIVYQSGWLYFDEPIHISGTKGEASSPVLIHDGDMFKVSDGNALVTLAVREVNGFSEETIGVKWERGFSLTIGRASSNDIVYNDEAVSRIHGRLSADIDGFIYTDMSSNGSYINGLFINQQRMHLNSGDVITIPPNMVLKVNNDAITVIHPE